jgi:ubiquinone/menaquinone biosynthesis C-methylase UbiE
VASQATLLKQRNDLSPEIDRLGAFDIADGNGFKLPILREKRHRDQQQDEQAAHWRDYTRFIQQEKALDWPFEYGIPKGSSFSARPAKCPQMRPVWRAGELPKAKSMTSPVAGSWAANTFGQQGNGTMAGIDQALGVNVAGLPVDPAHAWLQQTYDRTARNYRAQDEVHISGRDYHHVSKTLREVSSSFDREICVLDMGCGTGRYFHAVKNARELIGLDISQQMLDAARNPVRSDEVTAREVNLLRGDLFSAKFPDAYFDFIYCLGVFGNGCAITRRACAQIWKWLAPGGLWFFDATDVSHFPRRMRLKKNVAAWLYSSLPRLAKNAWVKRSGWPPFFGNELSSVRTRLQKAGFVTEWITSRRSQLPQGDGYKLEVLSRKPA